MEWFLRRWRWDRRINCEGMNLCRNRSLPDIEWMLAADVPAVAVVVGVSFPETCCSRIVGDIGVDGRCSSEVRIAPVSSK